MEDFIKYLISPLLSSPDDLKIESTDTSILVKAPKSDMGKLIGKNGQAVSHFRTLLKTYAKLHNQQPKYLQIQEVV